MTESNVLVWSCEECGHMNYPYGRTPVVLPAQLPVVKCENCGYVKKNAEWSDVETKKMMDRASKGLALSSSASSGKLDGLEAEVKVLRESHNADRKEMELVRKMLDDILDNILKQMRVDAAREVEDLASLTERVKALEEWKKNADELK